MGSSGHYIYCGVLSAEVVMFEGEGSIPAVYCKLADDDFKNLVITGMRPVAQFIADFEQEDKWAISLTEDKFCEADETLEVITLNDTVYMCYVKPEDWYLDEDDEDGDNDDEDEDDSWPWDK